MRDADIRSALVARLRLQHPDEITDRIVPEMSLCLGASRVDVGVVNGSISGYEIKSPRDNLGRLPGQVSHYSLVLDFATLVVSERYVERATSHLPDWWGVLRATDGARGVTFEEIRPATMNAHLDALSLAQFLWRDEAYAELAVRNLHEGLAKATRWVLWDALVEALALDELRRCVRTRLKARPARLGA